MTTIPQQQLFERFDSLPDSLREAIFDEPTTDFIWKTSEDEHIPDEQIYTISKLVGYVFMGFLHPEDLAQEIKENLNIDLRIATAIQDDLNKRIFAPLRPDLDKAYKPLGKTEMPSFGPKIIQDINNSPSVPKASFSTPKPLSIPTGIATSQSMSGDPSLQSRAIPNANIPPAAPQTNRLSDIGWSKSRSSAPVVKLDITQPPATAPVMQSSQQSRPATAASTSSPSSTQANTAPRTPALGEFERLSTMKRASTGAVDTTISAGVPAPTPAAPAASAHASDPAPFILHQDSSFAAPQKNADFKISQPQANADMHLSSVKSQSTIRPAVLEFAGQNNKPSMPSSSTSPSHVVHYTEFQPSLSKVPTQNSGPRQVSQVLPPTTTPAPTMPRPTPAPAMQTPAPIAAAIPVPQPPRPPQQSVASFSAPSVARPAAPVSPTQPSPVITKTVVTQQSSSTTSTIQPAPKEKVIVKDFL